MTYLRFLLGWLVLVFAFPNQGIEESPPYLYYYSPVENAFIIERADGSDPRIFGVGLLPSDTRSVSGPGWSPDGKRFAVNTGQSGRPSSYVIDPTTSAPVFSISQAAVSRTCLDISSATPLVEQQILTVDAEAIVSQLKWSPVGASVSASYVAVPVTERSERIRLWDLASGKNRIVFSRLDEPYAVTGSWAEWSPDGSRLALNSDGTVRIVSIDDGNIILLEDNPLGTARLVWSPDSSQLATIEWTHMIRIWDADSGKQVREFDAHGRVPDLRAAWTAQGLRWMTQDEERTVRVWEEGHDEPRFTLKPDYRLSSVWLSPSGKYIASSGLDNELVQLWNVDDGRLVQTLNAPVIEIIWTSDEACVATATWVEPFSLRLTRPQIWGVVSGELLQTIEVRIDARMSGVDNLAWSPDGTSLALIDQEGAIRVWGLSQHE